jgi:hypothetical protein
LLTAKNLNLLNRTLNYGDCIGNERFGRASTDAGYEE